MKYVLPILALTFTLVLNGCTTLVDATTREPINPDPTQRSLGTYIDDKRLQIIVAVNIRKAHPELKQSHINVTSFNGVILLTGQVPNPQLRLLAAQTAKSVSTVRQVHNELEIKGNIPFVARTNDTWLGTKIKAVLIADKYVSGLKIKVVVEDSTAYLMGLISQKQADRATNLVRNVSGVKEVVRVFEYNN